MKKHQRKQAGFIVSAELILIATILVIGLIVGMVAIRDAATAEMHDIAEALGALDQSYTIQGILDLGTNAEVGGTTWIDSVDTEAGDQLGIDYAQPGDALEDGL
jgi:hypothetical protein